MKNIKFSKNHTSCIDPVKKLLKKLNKVEGIEKISLGYISVVKRKSRKDNIKFKSIDGRLMLTVIGGTRKQEVIIYTKNPEPIIKIIDI